MKERGPKSITEMLKIKAKTRRIASQENWEKVEVFPLV
jgi:hypothetical protein